MGRIAWVGLLLFALAIALEHLLTPSLDPLEHQVSEYVHAETGVIMACGFAAWASSLAATARLIGLHWKDRLLETLFAFAAAGIAIVVLFPTETVAGEIPRGRSLTLTGYLHDLGSGLTTLALAAAALRVVSTPRSSRPLRQATAALLVTAGVVSVSLLAIGPSVGGLRQRLALLIGCALQILLLRAPAASPQPPPQLRQEAFDDAAGRS